MKLYMNKLTLWEHRKIFNSLQIQFGNFDQILTNNQFHKFDPIFRQVKHNLFKKRSWISRISWILNLNVYFQYFQVMKLYMNKLTPYEHHEIFNYPQIYFIGANAKKRPGIIGGPNNCGYDDDQGSYTHIAHDHLAYRYEVLKVIGKGSFGQVVKAYDHKCHLHVALKMVRNEKRFHRQAQEEIRILEHLRKQDKDNTYNIIHMFDHFVFRSHTCITFELLSINLYELIKKNKFQGFSLQLVRKFAHSLLQCLDLLYRNKIIHCDMKPENVLLKQQGRSGIKVGMKQHIHSYLFVC